VEIRPDKKRDTFLAETRICILTTLDQDGWPVAVPVWYEWDGVKVRVFTSAGSPKVAKLERDARASLLVTNRLGEPEYWVRIDATVAILKEGAAELAQRLADRYWDMSDEEHQQTVETWMDEAANLRLLEFTPTRIQTYR
jgi:PPOX class probable F420-dependent enzyme